MFRFDLCIDLSNYGDNGDNSAEGATDVAVAEVPAPKSVGIKPGTSDIDFNIPSASTSRENTFCVIIANETYRQQDTPNVKYAAQDGKTFQDYCLRTLGLPRENVRMASNASFLQMKSLLGWFGQVADVYGQDANFILYYAGHGVPDEKGNCKLIPADVSINDVDNGFSLKDLYASLGKMTSNNVLVLIDACFSGNDREDVAAFLLGDDDAPFAVEKGKRYVFFNKANDEYSFTCGEEPEVNYVHIVFSSNMRLGTDGARLYMLYATRHMVYDQVSFDVEGERYYGVERLPSRLHICEAAFPKERDMSLLIATRQRFADDRSEPRCVVSKRYADCSFTTTVNKNLLRFYDTYPTSMIGDDPMTRWAMYANTPVEEGVRTGLYPQMAERLKGLSQTDAVEKLLNWVQTGFEYEYDENVWGTDRAFFPEETLFYPCCDCEDRAILLTRMVRDLLGLRCMLVYYPGHLASAIALTEGDVQGDYIIYDGQRYIIADPTYINAPLGRTMPGLSNATAKVMLLADD